MDCVFVAAKPLLRSHQITPETVPERYSFLGDVYAASMAFDGVSGSGFNLDSPQKSALPVVGQTTPGRFVVGRGAYRWHFPSSAFSPLTHHKHSTQCTMSVSTSTGWASPSDGVSMGGEVVSGCSVGFVNASSPLAPTLCRSNARPSGRSGHRPSRSCGRIDARPSPASSNHHRVRYQPRSTSRRPIS